MHIIAFGDSLTAGYDVPPASGWLARIARRRPDWIIHNRAACGATLAAVTGCIAPAVCRTPSDLVWIMAGTNDILCDADTTGRAYTTPTDFLRPLCAAVTRLDADGIPVLIGAPPLITKDSVYHGWQTLPAWEISRDALARYAADLMRLFPGRVVDFTAALTAPDLYDDGVHPNIYGYERMAQIALPYFDRHA